MRLSEVAYAVSIVGVVAMLAIYPAVGVYAIVTGLWHWISSR